MTPDQRPTASDPAREAWLREQLAKAPVLTAEQQRDLRRVLLPATPAKKPA